MLNPEYLPEVKETVIEFEQEITVDDYPVYYRKWFKDGIKAESLIFKSADVDLMSDKDIQRLIGSTKYPKTGSGYAMDRRINGYTSVDFNFIME